MAKHNPVEGKGVFFPQQKKSERAPDWRGQILYKGEEIKISGWWRESAYGKFISLGVDTWTPEKAKEARKDAQYPKEVKPKEEAVFIDDQDVPF